MPPKVAALLTVAFIVWLFRRQSKEAGAMSPGCWIVFAWLSIIASRPLGYWFVNGTEAARTYGMGIAEGSFVDRNTYLFLIVLGVITLLGRRVTWQPIVRDSGWLWIFYFYLLLSVFWSDFVFISFKRWFKDFGNVVMIMIIVTEPFPLAAVRGLFVRVACLLIPVSVMVIKWFPDIGRYFHKWTWTTCYCGITTNKNSLADLAMLSGLVLCWNIVDFAGYPRKGAKIKDVWPDLFLFGMCVWILSIAQCATALSCFVVGIAVFFASRLDWAKRNLTKLGWCCLALAVLMAAFATVPDFRGAIAGLLGRDVTLTGRTDIWEAALKLPTNPLLGNGFASTWLTHEGAALAVELNIPHAHNGYLETFLQSGFIGVILLLAVLYCAGRTASRNLSGGAISGNFYMALFIVGVMYDFTEVAFDTGNIIGFVLWLMAAQGQLSDDLPASEVEAPEISAEDDLSDPALAGEHSNSSLVTVRISDFEHARVRRRVALPNHSW